MTPKTKSAFEKWLEEKDYLICGFDGNVVPYYKWPILFFQSAVTDFFEGNQIYFHIYKEIGYWYSGIIENNELDCWGDFKSRTDATAAAIQAASLILEERL